MSSSSAKSIANALGCKRIKLNGSKFKQREGDVVINWGCSSPPEGIMDCLNSPDAVRIAVDKLRTLNRFREFSIQSPLWDVFHHTAVSWIGQGFKVYCRKELQGKSGSGIIIASSVDELVDAPLYTREVKAAKEYRVHVFNGEVIDYAKKGRTRANGDETRPSCAIRSYSSGWIFIREGIQLPQAVQEESIKAVKALGLDFGAVDICTIKGTNDEQVCVYEVNSAPGLRSPTTIEAYKNAILKYIGGI